jgi:hypothetical protein
VGVPAPVPMVRVPRPCLCRLPTSVHYFVAHPVLYLTDPAAVAALVGRLEAIGHRPGPPENPYWNGREVTIEDPDGWRVVLVDAMTV